MLSNRQLFLIHIGQTSPAPMMLEIEKAEGVFMYGPGGKKYLDLISGVSVSNTGHSDPEVIEAIKKQVDSHLHLMVYGEMIQSPQVKLAELLTSILPSPLDNVYFVNSGSEAVEGALKLAKRHTRKSKIVYFRNAYHGSTHGALSVQGSECYKNAFRPLLPDTCQAEFNDQTAYESIDDHTACVILEPVQSEAGVIFPKPGFLEKLKDRCTQTGALLIFDEVQTGFGRTGTMFALERFNIVPDILVLAKALGGGMPLGAFIASKKIMDSLISAPQLGHITTFGGHPVCCAAGMASIKVLINKKLIEGSIPKSMIFRKTLVHPLITEIRGEGLLLAVQLKDPAYVQYIISQAPKSGLLLDYFLFCNDSFRIAPPLIISEDEIISACRQLLLLLDEAKQNVNL